MSPLNQKMEEMLKNIEWGEFKLEELFEKIKVKSLKYKTSELPDKKQWKYILPALTAWIQNQWLNNFVPKENATILKNVISISANWANTGVTFYQSKEFTVLQDAYAIDWKDKEQRLTDNNYLFLVSAIRKTIFWRYEWTNKAGWEKIKSETISLPTKNWKIDFDFMEKFIEEIEKEKIRKLEKYLEENNLKDYALTSEEKQVLEDFENWNIEWGEFRIWWEEGEFRIWWEEGLFKINHYWKQRSQNDLQREWELKYNFVMQNENNNWVIEKVPEQIWNDFNLIPWKSISAFTHLNKVYYQEEPFYSKQWSNVYTLRNKFLNKKNAMFFISAINIVIWKIGYWKNTASRLEKYNIQLPVKNNNPDFEKMEILISAVEKLVVKKVVEYVKGKK